MLLYSIRISLLNLSEKILVDGDDDDDLGDGVAFFLRRVGILDPAWVELN